MSRPLSCSGQMRRGPSLTRLCLAALLLCCLWCIAAGAATFTATLDRDTVTLGESATLSLSFEGGTPKSVPSPADIPNLQIAYSGTAQSITTVNGQFSATVSYNFTVTPRQPGDYTIPALSTDVGGEKLTSQALTLKVLKPTAPPPEAVNSGTQLAFLRLVLPKKEMYVGETTSAQLQLYLLNRVQRVSGFQLTSFPADGFSVGKMVEGQRRQTQVGNAVYTMIPLVFPIRAIKNGAMALGPVTANVVLDLPSGGGRGSLFEQ